MNTTQKPRSFILAGMLLVAAAALPSLAAQGVIKFTFRPPTPLAHTLTLKTIKTVGTQTDVGVAKAKVRIAKTSKGYQVVTTPSSLSMKRNGKTMPRNPIVDRLMKMTVTSDLNGSGKMLSVKGFDEVIKTLTKELKPTMPAQQYRTVVAALPGIKKSAIAKEITEWNGRVADFVGRSAKVGDHWVADQIAEMPYGTITYDTTSKVAGRVQKGKIGCVRINFYYTTDAKGAKKYMQQSAASRKTPRIVDVTISGGGDRVVDPRTMLIYSETSNRKITMTMDNRQKVTTQEKREYSYQYGK